MDVLIWLFRLSMLPFRLIFLIIRAARGRAARRDPRRLGSHGTARWARRWEQWWYGVITGEGVILGRGAFRRLLRFTTDGIVMVFATTGAGKGLGIVIPSLLTYPGSMVVTDPKGENYDITRRRRAAFGRVRMLNPVDLTHSDRFNPLDIIRRGTLTEVDDAGALATLMIKPDGRETHWDDKAASVLKALILHTLEEPPASRTLANVRRLSASMKGTFLATLEEIATASPSLAAREIAAGALTSALDDDGNLSPEFGSILSNLQKATEPWSAGTPAGRLSSSSTFSLSELTDEVSTLFLCVDEDLLDVYDRWLRVMVGCVLKTMTRAKASRPKHKVVLMLDEIAVLGRLDPLEKQSGLLRAYCTPVLIWQSLPQITRVYGDDAKAFLSNATARVFFGVNDNDTAEYVAGMIGNTTTLSSSVGESQHDSRAGRSRSTNQSESGYWLMDSAEIQRLPLNRIIVKVRGIPFPIFGRRVDYRKVWRWRGLWDQWRGPRLIGLNSEPSPPDDTRPPAPPTAFPRPADGQGSFAAAP